MINAPGVTSDYPFLKYTSIPHPDINLPFFTTGSPPPPSKRKSARSSSGHAIHSHTQHNVILHLLVVRCTRSLACSNKVTVGMEEAGCSRGLGRENWIFVYGLLGL
jgi:hypothetical protein